jgi:hypothetical protein
VSKRERKESTVLLFAVRFDNQRRKKKAKVKEKAKAKGKKMAFQMGFWFRTSFRIVLNILLVLASKTKRPRLVCLFIVYNFVSTII